MGRTLVFLLLLVSCSHQERSQYRAYKKKEGFQEKTQGLFRVVSFRGNDRTKSQEVLTFARFRAIELCPQQLSYVLDIHDKTEKKEVIRTSGYAQPGFGFGMTPYYGRSSSMGVGFGSYPMNAWSETQVYPNIEVIYQCATSVRSPGLKLREVSKEEMKLLVKDLKGGLQVEQVDATSPNAHTLVVGDIILKFNEQRVETVEDVLVYLMDHGEARVDLLREGEKLKTKILSRETTSAVREDQQRVIQEACEFEEIKTKLVCQKP